jgi:hypothetical protein
VNPLLNFRSERKSKESPNLKKSDKVHEILKYRDEDMIVELPTNFRTVRAQLHFTVRSQSTKVTFRRVESVRGEATDESDKLTASARFNCLSRTVRALMIQTVCSAVSDCPDPDTADGPWSLPGRFVA